ncbi:MAG: hypothetical protein JW839_03600 [Candidatus Lokiarchaeota archaeon]|nr:hypothetical protein [Candidatus Lokiarchaeota archaeon]
MILQTTGFGIAVAFYPFFAFTPVAVFLMLFLRQFTRTRQKMFLHLAMLFASTILNQACLICMVLVSRESVAKGLFIAAQVLEVTGMLVMVIVLEAFEENKAFSPRVAGFTAISSAAIGAIVSEPVLETITVEMPLGTAYLFRFYRFDVTGLLLGSIPLLGILWILVSFATKRKLARSGEQRRLLFLLYLGIFLGQFTGTFAPLAIESASSHGLGDLASSVGLTRVVGIIIIGFAFHRVSRKPWLLQLQKIHLLLVYAKNGITLYSRRFREDISEDDVQLLAGAISAVASLFRESTKETSPIEAIEFKGKAVRVIDRDEFTCAVMVDYASQATDDAQERFVRDFETAFAAEIAGFTGEVSRFEKAEGIAAKYFA